MKVPRYEVWEHLRGRGAGNAIGQVERYRLCTIPNLIRAKRHAAALNASRTDPTTELYTVRKNKP
jgi:hypothetical protein